MISFLFCVSYNKYNYGGKPLHVATNFSDFGNKFSTNHTYFSCVLVTSAKCATRINKTNAELKLNTLKKIVFLLQGCSEWSFVLKIGVCR